MPKIQLKNVIWKEGKYFVAWNINTNISSFGKTKKEAINSLQEALELHFEDISIKKMYKVENPNLVPIALHYA